MTYALHPAMTLILPCFDEPSYRFVSFRTAWGEANRKEQAESFVFAG